MNQLKTHLLMACLSALSLPSIILGADQPINAYSSGSTGVHGAFEPTIVNTIDGPEIRGVPQGTRLFRGRQSSQTKNWLFIPLTPDGFYHFTSFNLPADFILAFDTRGTTNPGVTILSQQHITIGGVISVGTAETLMAYNPAILALPNPPGTSHEYLQVFFSNIAGPGGYAGGAGFRGMGTGPNPGIGRNGAGSVDPSAPRFLPATLPLTGGSGSGSTDTLSELEPRNRRPGMGGGGTLVLGASGEVRFTGGKILAGSASYYYYVNDTQNHLLGGYPDNDPTRMGSLAIFANEVRGVVRSDIDETVAQRVLIAAFDQENYVPARINITPPWPVGVSGLDMPIHPSASFVELNGQDIRAFAGGRVVMPSQGSYPLTIETRNLPAGVIFRTTIHRLDAQGTRTGISQVDFPATVSVSPGVCQARASIPIETGSQFLTAIAKAPLQTAFCPVLDGEPLDTLVAEVDSNGKQSLRFRTASGREVSWDDALSTARRQGKSGFPKSAI